MLHAVQRRVDEFNTESKGTTSLFQSNRGLTHRPILEIIWRFFGIKNLLVANLTKKKSQPNFVLEKNVSVERQISTRPD